MGKLTAEDCMCPICLCIFVEPVTMPCSHTLCMACFKQNVEETNLTCPMCRTRISVWSRRATKSGTLVNTELWTQIKELFPDKVEKRLAGVDDEDDDDEVYQPFINIAEPGEIRKEYEDQLKRLAEQREKEQQKEMEASEALVRKLQEEEMAVVELHRKQQKNIEENDIKLAKELHSVIEEAGTDMPFGFLMQESRKRMTRSASSMSSASCSSASSSRPASTIESFIHKMREAEKLREADRVPGIKSPYPYSCYSPTEKDNSAKKESNSTSSVSKSDGSDSVNAKSCNNSSLDYDMSDIQCEDEGIFADQLARDFSSKSNCSSDVEIVSCSKSTGKNSRSKFGTNCRIPFVDLTETPTLDTCSAARNKSPEIEMLTAKLDKEETVVMTPLDRFLRRHGSRSSRTGSSQSNDSIGQELTHFKPIKVCPLTPPKKLANGTVVETQIIRTTPRNLSKPSLSSPHSSGKSISDIDASSPIMQRRLSELEEERKLNVKKLSKFTFMSNENGFLSVTEMLPSGDKKKSCSFSPLENQKNKKNKLEDHLGYCSSPDDSQTKKLVIPLESNIDDIMDFDIPPLSVNNNISNIECGRTLTSSQRRKLFTSCSDNDEKQHTKKKQDRLSIDMVSKKKFGKLSLAKGKHDLYSPQRSIKEWIKGDNSFKSGLPSSDLHCEAVHVVHCGRDEVDGNMSFIAQAKSDRKQEGKLTTVVHGPLDQFFTKDKSKCSPGSYHTRHIRKTTKRLNEYVYPELSPKKRKLPVMKPVMCSDDELSEKSDAEISDVSRVTEQSCESVPGTSRRKGRQLYSDSDVSAQQETKKQKPRNNSSTTSTSTKLKSLKKGKTKQQNKNMDVCMKKKSKYWTFEPVYETKTVENRIERPNSSEVNKGKKLLKRVQVYDKETGTYSPDPDLDSNCNFLHCQDSIAVLDKDQQEAMDKLLALKLEKQFQLEKKFRLGSLRFKESDGEYNLRRKAQS